MLVFYFSPSNGQNIVQLLLQSAKKWSPGRERFECLIHELDGTIEIAVCKSYRFTKHRLFCFCYLFQSSFLMCINAIFVTISTEHRYHLRSELFRSGFKSRFEVKD
jgi:hypothetical protein